MNSTKDFPKMSISQRIVQNIGNYWQDHDYKDFEVTIDGESIRCHSFILASCSGFFKNLLKSNMTEKQEMKVDLQNIPLKTFQLILKTLYTGCDLLTKDNVLEVWSAVHQLQIQFLVQRCEDFVMEKISLETLEAYKRQAESFKSRKVSERIFKYMLENFMTLRHSMQFLRLDIKDISRLVVSNSLVATSEDLVIRSIYDWVNYGETAKIDNKVFSINEAVTEVAHSVVIDAAGQNENDLNLPGGNKLEKGTDEGKSNECLNNSVALASTISPVNETDDGAPSAGTQQKVNPRLVYLLPLLKSTRYFLLSNSCIASLYRSKLIQHNTQSAKVFFKSLAHKTSIYVNGYLPPAALHRECSQFENAGVVCYDFSKIAAYSFAKHKWLFVPNTKNLNVDKFVVLNQQLYACVNYMRVGEVFVLQNQQWESVLKLKEEIFLFFAHQTSIYIITEQNSLVFRYQPFGLPDKINLDIGKVSSAISFGKNILVFYCMFPTTVVRCWDTDDNTLTYLTEFQFWSSRMTNFSDDRRSYILDTLGQLYEIIQYKTIQFNSLARLWGCNILELSGAVLFRQTLFIYCRYGEYDEHREQVKGVFSSLRFLRIGKSFFTSNFIVCDILKRDLMEASDL